MARRARQLYDKKYIVALDIGTARLGLAYGAVDPTDGPSDALIITFDGKPTAPSVVLIECKSPGPDFDDLPRGPNQEKLILEEHIDFSKTLVGYAARDEYNSLDKIRETEVAYFEQFKSSLTTLSTNDPVCKDFSGSFTIRAELLYTAVMRRLQDIAVEFLVKASARFSAASEAELKRFRNESAVERQARHMDGGSEPETLVRRVTGRTRYVVTVPAMWEPRAKQILRSAALDAGLASPEEDDLMISIEPEAASFAVRHHYKGLEDSPELNAEDAYMVCDCGGGTVDFTCHVQTEESLVVREALANAAGPWGSMKLDVALLGFIKEMLSPHHDVPAEKKENVIKLADRGAFLELVDNIERAKLVASAVDSRKIAVAIPERLINALETLLWGEGSDRTDVVKRNWRTHEHYKKVKDPQFVDLDTETDYDVISLKIARAVYAKLVAEPIHSEITAMVQTLMADAYMTEKARYIFLVGGFSQSAVLRAAIQKLCDDHYRQVTVLCPPDPETAVVAGAIYFGRNPAYIRSRKMKYSFGVEVIRAFREGFDPVQYSYEHADGAAYVRSYLELVSRDQVISFDFSVTHEFEAPLQESVQINLYRTSYQTPSVYLGVATQFEKHGSVVVDLAPLRLREHDRRVVLEFTFRVTELHVCAYKPDGGLRSKARLRFGLDNVEHIPHNPSA